MIEFLFLDLDDTILDFHRAEHLAVGQVIAQAGVEPTDALCARYSQINKSHWERLERGETTREAILVDRFADLFRELGTDADPIQAARNYERLLGQGHYYLPGAEETVKQRLFGRYRLFLASNGTASVQHGRLTSARLYPYFERVFVSQEIGFNKPAPEYFQRCFEQIPGFDPASCLMVGDSLTSDILGGLRAGIRTCWVNPAGTAAPAHIQPDHQISALAELPALLEQLDQGGST